jgi:hypothetical protein
MLIEFTIVFPNDDSYNARSRVDEEQGLPWIRMLRYFYYWFLATESCRWRVFLARRCIRLCIQLGRIGGRLGALIETSHPFYGVNDTQDIRFAR